MAERCGCGHHTEDHQRKRFITDYTAPCDKCGCKDFAPPVEDKEQVPTDD